MDVVMGLRRTLQLYPEKIAALEGAQSWTYREFDNRVKKLANALLGLGMSKGDQVSLLMLNGHRYLETYYGVMRAGMRVVPINIRLAGPEVAYILQDSESKAFIVDDAFAPMAAALKNASPHLKHFIHAGSNLKVEDPEMFVSYETLLEQASDQFDDEAIALQDEDLAGIFYTGGTTAKSKGVMLNHRNLVTNAYHLLLGNMNPADGIVYSRDAVYLHAAPMFHLADTAVTFALTAAGGTHSFIPFFDPKAVLATIQAHKVTNVTLVPTMINMLINLPGIDDYDLSSLKYIGYGASPIAPDLLKRAMHTFKGVRFAQGYGQTEAAPMVSTLGTTDHVAEGDEKQMRRLASAGRAIMGIELKIMDSDDKELPFGSVGEIVTRGPNVMVGYWKLPNETADALRNGWLHTGDLGYMDEDGYIFLVDRRKDMIVSGGENVFSVEVENVLYQHPAVLETAVIGIPSPKWGEAVHAVVVLKPGQQASEEEIIEFCRQEIAGYKVPRSVEFADALPKSGAGKILKRNLRDKFWEGASRNIN